MQYIHLYIICTHALYIHTYKPKSKRSGVFTLQLTQEQINISVKYIFIVFIFFFSFLFLFFLLISYMYSKNDLLCFLWPYDWFLQLNLWEEHFACYFKLMQLDRSLMFFHSFVLDCGSTTVFLKECLVPFLWVSIVFVNTF